MSLQALNIQEALVDILQSELETLKAQIRGELITQNDMQYNAARSLWNAMIDRKPAVIVRCTGTADVIHTVRFAHKHQLLISVKSGGHNIAGRALRDNTLLIDLSNMRNIKVDPDKKMAIVGPGATLRDVDHETQIHGLVVPTGINSTTGIAGLTLGGGFGWLSRKLGMTIDSLISAEVVTVKGEHLICDEKNHPDLFWAIKGGGGNFAIVTSFTFKLHPIRTMALSGPVIFDIKEANSVLQNFRNLCQNSENDLTTWAVLRHAPPFPFLDKSYHGKPVLIIVFIYFGEEENDKVVLDKILALGKPIAQGAQVNPFSGFQQAFDPLLTPGARNYWKTHNFKTLSDDLINTVIDYANHLPSPQTEVFIAQMGGVTNQVATDASAYPHRDINFVMNVHVRWQDKQEDKKCMDSGKQFYQATLPFATGGAYVNFVSEGDENIKNTYGTNEKKLSQIKAQYDPENVLRANINIIPR